MIKTLSPSATIFIYQSNKVLTENDNQFIDQTLRKFVDEWSSHGARLKADFIIKSPLFVIVGVDESYADLGGCSKDALNQELKAIGKELNVDFFDRLSIAYKNNQGEISLANMVEFKTMVKSDEIRQNTIVFNNLIEKNGDLENNWEVEVKNSWHNSLVPIL